MLRCGHDPKAPEEGCFECDGYIIVGLRLERDRLRDVLLKLEWHQDEELGALWCPSCFSQKPQGHTEACELGWVLHGAFRRTTTER